MSQDESGQYDDGEKRSSKLCPSCKYAIGTRDGKDCCTICGLVEEIKPLPVEQRFPQRNPKKLGVAMFPGTNTPLHEMVAAEKAQAAKHEAKVVDFSVLSQASKAR